MRIGRRKTNDQTPGDDSFLDIVANLVGVLIILVVVVSAHAGSTIRAAAVSNVDLKELEDVNASYQEAAQTALNWERDNHKLEDLIDDEQQVTEQRRFSRNRLLVEIEAVKRELNGRRHMLSEEHQEFLKQQDRLTQLRDKLDALHRSESTLRSAYSQTKVIDHHPTPIAKTVFSDEVHFRLSGGKIVHVPLEELIDLMRDQWQETAKKLDRADETIETVGPIGEFRLQYRLQADEVVIRTAYGDLVRRATEFKRFVLVPTTEKVGHPFGTALKSGSTFHQRIERLNPSKTTISIWVYPDSFSEFNQLKKWLYERGFQTACWPLSHGNLISGGPSGYRSTAQ